MLEIQVLIGNALNAIKQQDAQQAKLGLGIALVTGSSEASCMEL